MSIHPGWRSSCAPVSVSQFIRSSVIIPPWHPRATSAFSTTSASTALEYSPTIVPWYVTAHARICMYQQTTWHRPGTTWRRHGADLALTWHDMAPTWHDLAPTWHTRGFTATVLNVHIAYHRHRLPVFLWARDVHGRVAGHGLCEQSQLRGQRHCCRTGARRPRTTGASADSRACCGCVGRRRLHCRPIQVKAWRTTCADGSQNEATHSCAPSMTRCPLTSCGS